MGIAQERTERLEALRGLIERLSAPDLTLADAKVLRGRVAELLDPVDRRLRHDPPAASPTVITSSDRREIWSSEPSIRMAV